MKTFLLVILFLFIFLSIIALIKKGDSVYENEPKQKNPYEGKEIIFVENENEPENADGKKGRIEIVGISSYKTSFYDKYIKRFFDVVLSFIALIILSPVFLIISIAIYIDDPGTIFFVQKRVGKNKRFFKLHKFRSMKMSAPHEVPTHRFNNPEEYITKVGKFIRSHSLDELPQIWDIFIGNMSIVGPRPALWNQDYLTAERDKYNANDIRPGLTGWAQINGRDTLLIDDKARYDGHYIERESFIFDANCVLKTLKIFKKDNSIKEGVKQ